MVAQHYQNLVGTVYHVMHRTLLWHRFIFCRRHGVDVSKKPGKCRPLSFLVPTSLLRISVYQKKVTALFMTNFPMIHTVVLWETRSFHRPPVKDRLGSEIEHDQVPL